MDKAYPNKISWQNSPSTSTALGATNLNKMDNAIYTIDDRVVAIDTSKANQSTVNGVVQSITYNSSTGVLTVTKVNGTTSTIDTKLEKLAVNFVYDPEEQELVITLDDGTTQHVDMSALITQYDFANTNTIAFTLTDGVITANVVNGSITAEKLQPDYLANITTQANAAANSASQAQRWAVGGIESGDDTDNSKYYSEQSANLLEMMQDLADITFPVFSINLTTGHLESTEPVGITFSINESGHLISEVA